MAALTLPQVLTGYEKKATETRLKKDYSTFANALKMAEAEYGSLETWDTPNPNTAYKEYFKRLAKYIQFAKEPCYDEFKCFPKNPGSYYNGVFFRLKDGTYGIYSDNAIYNGGHKTENPKHFFLLLTSNSRAIPGRTYFKYSVMNLRDIKIQSNVGCGQTICYRNSVPKCEPNNGAWSEYYCSIKFIMDGFKFKDDYNFSNLNKHDSTFENLLKTKPSGWQ